MTFQAQFITCQESICIFVLNTTLPSTHTEDLCYDIFAAGCEQAMPHFVISDLTSFYPVSIYFIVFNAFLHLRKLLFYK